MWSISAITHQTVTVSSSMESCHLPMELCEEVINALPEYSERQGYPVGWLKAQKEHRESQQALCACALTCRAWRFRAQHLLWTFPHLFDSRRLAQFTTAIRRPPHITITRGLVLGDVEGRIKTLDLRVSSASELFMHSFPHLQHLLCFGVLFAYGPPLRVLRMHLPFFANINDLQLSKCTFQSLRGMLDVVWACPNLVSLFIWDCSFHAEYYPSAAGLQHMFATVANLRACRKLTRLRLDGSTLRDAWDPDSVGLRGGGTLFGCAVTHLMFITVSSWKVLGSLLRHSFPSLRSVKIVSHFPREVDEDGSPVPPWLHTIATSHPVPETLTTIVLKRYHTLKDNDCCKEAVGTSEEVVGSEKQLPELLPSLMKLKIRLDQCKDPGECAAYIWSILPGMHHVLMFEYRMGVFGGWTLYTLPATR